MSRYNYYGFAPYVSVAEKRRNAEKLTKKLEKNGGKLEPVLVTGSKFTTTFWGKSWNQNLERYRDYENRLPRGRSYLRHGAVIDLKVTDGLIEALVSGSSLYRVRIKIKPLKKDRWQTLKRTCSGQITSLIGLLQGKLPPPVMAAVTMQDSGLFPEPKDISFECSCPDYAGICKHCAAAVYGVGVRLDDHPELLFLLRGVDHLELITGAGDAVIAHADAGAAGVTLDDIGGIFGIELDPALSGTTVDNPSPVGKPTRARPAATQTPLRNPAQRATTQVAKTAATQVAKATTTKVAKAATTQVAKATTTKVAKQAARKSTKQAARKVARKAAKMDP
ncbi:MAG: hypothetical protein NTW21_07055 [Verrucomicrobia bacterium]|nr:hypothetical protein [Verrucomicrobiota bacterium]